MRPALFFGIIFGIISLIQNILLATKISEKSIGIILISGVLFFNIFFTVLFTKKNNQYQLPFVLGFKSSIQAGLIQGIGYFISIVLLRKWIAPHIFPDLNQWSQYFMIFNLNIILFAVASALFGAIATILLMNKQP